jgi:hypothetical protein
MQTLQLFHRVFLVVEDDRGASFKLFVWPDSEQRQGRTGPTVVISCMNNELLGLCMAELGITGYSHFLGETACGPLSSYHECPAEEMVARLKSAPLSPLAQVTLIAVGTMIGEMKRRVAVLREKAGGSLHIEETEP